jgi:SOS-response transcriptional repressor LexA
VKASVTEKDRLVLDFIKAYTRLHGIAPSYAVVARGLGMKSKSNIHRVIHKLIAEGAVLIKPHKARSVRVLDRSVRAISKL